MNFSRPKTHGEYFDLWKEIVGMIPWEDPQHEGIRQWIPRVDKKDFEERCGEFIRHARAFFRNDLYALMRFGLSHGDRFHANVGMMWLDQPWLFDKIRKLDHRWRTGTLHGVWLEWSRRHWKSTTLQALAIKIQVESIEDKFDPLFHYYSRTIGLAEERMGDIRKEIETNKLLRRLFPERFYENPIEEASEWTDRQFFLKRVSRARAASKQPTFKAFGVIGGIATGAGANVIFADDIEDDENAHVLAQVMKTSKKMRQALKCVDPSNSKYRLTVWANTQYSAAGPMSKLHEDGFISEAWVEPAADWDKPDPNLGKEGLDIGGHTPVLMTAEELKDARGEGSGPWRDFCLQYLCRLDIAQTTPLNPDRAGRYVGDPGKGNYYILMDPGGTPGTTDSTRLDDTAIWVVSLGRDGQVRIVDGELDLMTLPDRIRHIMRLHRKWSRRGTVIETRIEECGPGGDCAALAMQQKNHGYVFRVVRIAWGGVNSLSKKEREHRYIDRFLDQLLVPASMYRSRRGDQVDLVENLFRQMRALAETDDDHPLDALALLGTPYDKNVRIYEGGREPREDTLGELAWPSQMARWVPHDTYDPVSQVAPENQWMVDAMGLGGEYVEDEVAFYG